MSVEYNQAMKRLSADRAIIEVRYALRMQYESYLRADMIDAANLTLAKLEGKIHNGYHPSGFDPTGCIACSMVSA